MRETRNHLQDFVFLIYFTISLMGFWRDRYNSAASCETMDPLALFAMVLNIVFIIFFCGRSFYWAFQLQKSDNKEFVKSKLKTAVLSLIFFIAFPGALWFGLGQFIPPKCG